MLVVEITVSVDVKLRCQYGLAIYQNIQPGRFWQQL